VGICQAIVSGSTGVTAQASIADGIYFIFGKFLNVFSQSIRLEDYNQFPSVNVGLEAIETIVTPEEDPSLNSNAIGSPDYAAPGAHRYKIVLNLVALPATAIPDNEFTSLMVITNGIIQSQIQVTALSEIAKTLARRTYDANGNFITTPFGFDMHEGLLVGNNGGIYTSAQGGQEDELALGIEPGKAYVEGFEIQTIAKQYLSLNKARSTNFFQNSHTRAYLGNYVFINRLFGIPNYDTWPKVNLYGTPIVTDGVAPATSVIGTATIRGLQFQEGSFQVIGDPGPIFQCFLSDINISVSGYALTDIRSLTVTDGTFLSTANILTQVDIVNVVGSFTPPCTITDGTNVETVYAWDDTNNLLLTLPITVASGRTISISLNSPITSTVTGSANILQRITLFDTADNILIYQLPQNTVSTVKDTSGNTTTSYPFRQVFTPVVPTSSKATFATSTNQVFSAMDITDYVATVESSSPSGLEGTLIDVSNSSPTFASALTQLTFNVPATATHIKLSATVITQISVAKTKALQNQILTVTSPGNNINLGKADIYQITGIWTGTDDTGTDITSWYSVNNGQYDNRYDYGTLTILPGYTSPSSIYIKYAYFTHGGGDYFSADSYVDFNSPLTNWYLQIPTYHGSNGTVYALRNCLDFRPRVNDSATPTSAIAKAAVPSPPVYGSVGRLVKPNDDVVTDFSYYLARVDKIYLSKTGTFVVIEGTPSLAPLEPPDPSSGMVVAILTYPAYTFSPESVIIQIIPNKVYTMAAIGKIVERVTNLEYLTALTLLEQQTASMQIPDATTGLNRYQAGFVVDNFVDNSVADYTNTDIHYALDAPNNIMRPTYNTNTVNMGYDETQSSDIEYRSLKPTNNILTLPYTEAPVVTQPMASRQENLNPYNIFQFIGSMTLDPATDTWVSITYAPDINVTDNTLYDATQSQTSNVLGTIWNAWTTDWTGTTQSTATTIGTAPTIGLGQPGSEGIGTPPTGPETITATTYDTIAQQTRTGTITTLVNVPNKTVNTSKVVSTAMVPYCRANTIAFSAKGLKPFTQVWPFLDITPVAAYCTPSTLITDANGAVSGVFNLPDPSITQAYPSFRTGIRVFELCNDPNQTTSNITTYAKANYIASGVLDTDQQTITSVGVPEIQTQTVSQTQTVDLGSYTVWVDPLAQSFLVNTLQGGYCITSLDVYFATKDPNIPVTLQIRQMLNGIPTQSIVPFSTVVLNPSDINTSTDASVKTNFKFPSPVYLQQGVAYAIVLMSNSNNYWLWTALMGEDVLNTDVLISQVPYAGLLFKSQNASTWVPSPAEAMKFTLYRAVFNYGVLGTAILENPILPVKSLPDLSLITYSGGLNAIRVSHPNHGMPVGSLVTITIPPGAGNANWAASYNGIAVSYIVPTISGDLRASSWDSGIADTVLGSRTYMINNIELDSYTIFIVDGSNAVVNASSSGLTGVALTCTENYAYDVMMPIVNELNFTGTSTNYYMRAITGQSTHGIQVPYNRVLSGSFPFNQFTPNQNVNLPAPQLVASAINESQLIDFGTPFAKKSLVWEIDLTSSSDNLSPMVDASRCAALLISNRIDYRKDATTPPTSPAGAAPAYVAETVSSGETDEAVFITRPVTLQNPANSIHFWLTIMWPYGAQVDIYYKILPTNTNATFASQNYVLLDPDPNTNFAPAQNQNDFKDYYWHDDYIGDFTTFSIKVVMRSTNSSAVPLCRQLRAISLET
jgi:hypothetical protein